MDLGKNILKHREQLGLSQEQLAFKLGITAETVNLWEANEAQPTIEQLKLLSSVFAVSIDQLCGNATADKSPLLFTTSTTYSKDIYERANKHFYSKILRGSIIACAICLFFVLYILIGMEYKGAIIIPIALLVIFAVRFFNTRNKIKKLADESATSRPNAHAQYLFYADYFVINVTADNGSTSHTKRYTELSQKYEDNQYIYLTFGSFYFVIDKQDCVKHLETLCRLLKVENKHGKNKNYKLLSTFFVLTIVAIFAALYTTAIVSKLSPLPQFPSTMIEYMWIFLLFLPIPLTSIVLGIVFGKKGYKCKRNIIAGVIVGILLCAYGSFTPAFSLNISHDMQYLQEIEQQIHFDFPEGEYITIEYDYTPGCESFAMVKMSDDSESLLVSNMQASGKWHSSMPSLPLNPNVFYPVAVTEDYEYFAVYNLSTNSYDSYTWKLIYMAYDLDTNILCICCFE